MKTYNKITNRLPSYINPDNHMEMLPEKQYMKVLKYQQKNYYKILSTRNYQKIAFSNLKMNSEVPFDFAKYYEDWVGCIPLNVLPLYARIGADAVTLTGEEIETKLITINESYWCIGPRGGITTKSGVAKNMGSYYGIKFGTNFGQFNPESKRRHTYTVIISKMLGRIASIYYLNPDKIVELLTNYSGGHPKIKLSKIQEFGNEFTDGLPIYGWNKYEKYLRQRLPKKSEL